ncbi:MAG: AAA family ATPase [Defluviitaleaceae bacterium]|nr:AAA family ATPase [Defluviitaleaceae bacterium]
MKNRIHIFGASGSGTSTIAEEICQRIGYKHFDTDSYYWQPTSPPFTKKRPIEERLALMNTDLAAQEKWVLSGSLDGWGNPLIPLFELAVFVYVPNEIRIERLKARETQRYGEAILPGGSMHASSREFINWAAGYESGELTGRSLPRHQAWMAQLKCELLRIENISLEDSVNAIITSLKPSYIQPYDNPQHRRNSQKQ